MTRVYVSGGSGRQRFQFLGSSYTKAQLKSALKTRGITVYYSGSKPSLKADDQLDYIIGPGGHLSSSSQKVADRHPEARVLSWDQFMAQVLSRGIGSRSTTTQRKQGRRRKSKKAGSGLDLMSLLAQYKPEDMEDSDASDSSVSTATITQARPRRVTNVPRRGMEIFWDSNTALSFLTSSSSVSSGKKKFM